MQLKGKKIAFLGDSITAGCGTTEKNKIFWNLIAEETGAISYGYGIGGTRIAPQHTPTAEPECDCYFASRVDDMIPDADIVVVFGGTNDFGHGDAMLGTSDDRCENTFCGALRALLEKLIARYPYAQFVVMTPTHREVEMFLKPINTGAPRLTKLEEYVNAITEICGYYAIPVLDLFRTSGLQPRVPLLKERYMPDGLHPNDAGHRRIADRLIGFLSVL